MDEENDRYEAALAHRRLATDAHRSAERSAGKVTKAHERELLERRERRDQEAIAGKEMTADEAEALVAAGPPEVGLGGGGRGWMHCPLRTEPSLTDARGRGGGEGNGKRSLSPHRPQHCTTPGVYDMVGCEEPPTAAQINEKRLWSDFTVFTGSGGGNGYDGAYQDAAKMFTSLGQKHGFDAMFTYRFS